jgi:hypothetical protein
MDTPQKSSKPINSAAAIVFGVLCFGLAGLTFWSGVSGMLAGKTHTMGRGAHDLIVQQDTPREFWFWIAAHFLAAIIGVTGAVLIFISGFRRIRRG